jgi:hypothetical protein
VEEETKELEVTRAAAILTEPVEGVETSRFRSGLRSELESVNVKGESVREDRPREDVSVPDHPLEFSR